MLTLGSQGKVIVEYGVMAVVLYAAWQLGRSYESIDASIKAMQVNVLQLTSDVSTLKVDVRDLKSDRCECRELYQLAPPHPAK